MNVIKMPADGKKFVDYEVDGKTIDFQDGELTIRADKKERDYDVTIDICEDYTGGLVMGAGAGDRYVAQLKIPAREYEEIEKDNPDYNPEDAEGTAQATVKELTPVPFSMDKCTLTLWEMED